MPFEVFGHIECVQEFAIKAGEHHLDHNNHIEFFAVREVFVGILLILDAPLHVTIVFVEQIYAKVGAELGIIIIDDFCQLALVLFRTLLIVGFLLRQVFIRVVAHRRSEHGCDVERLVVRIFLHERVLQLLENVVKDDGFRDGRRCKQGVEAAVSREGVVVVEDMLYDLPYIQRLLYRIPVSICITIMLYLESQDVVVRDGVRDGVLVQTFLEHVLGRNVLCLLAVDTGVATVLLEYRSTGKAK